jgi:hypothetical protein
MGALIAGAYGVVHDQITYTISPEYFTKLKFNQFRYADFGWPTRFFVGEVGFLATWWVGFISGWFLARLAVPVLSTKEAMRQITIGFAVIFTFAAAAFTIGYFFGLRHIERADVSGWEAVADPLGVGDLRSFVRVAYIHNASYLGGVAGLIVALVRLKRQLTGLKRK